MKRGTHDKKVAGATHEAGRQGIGEEDSFVDRVQYDGEEEGSGGRRRWIGYFFGAAELTTGVNVFENELNDDVPSIEIPTKGCWNERLKSIAITSIRILSRKRCVNGAQSSIILMAGGD